MRVKMKNQKKAVKLAPKDYVNTLIWFLGGFWAEIMLDGNFIYNLGADTCTEIQDSPSLPTFKIHLKKHLLSIYTDN